MPDLENRVARLEDEREILRTLHQYGHTLDYGPLPDFLDCFTPDATWERVRRRNPDDRKSFNGHQELTRFFHSHRRAPDLYYKHLLVEPRIEVAGDRATVTSYFVKIDEHPEGPYVYAFGRYRDQLARWADGRWRLAWRRAETEDGRAREWTRERDAAPRT